MDIVINSELKNWISDLSVFGSMYASSLIKRALDHRVAPSSKYTKSSRVERSALRIRNVSLFSYLESSAKKEARKKYTAVSASEHAINIPTFVDRYL